MGENEYPKHVWGGVDTPGTALPPPTGQAYEMESYLPSEHPENDPKRPKHWPWITGAVGGVIGIMIGAVAAGGGGPTTITSTSPTVTATVTAAAKPGQTVKVPGPTKTVVKTVEVVAQPKTAFEGDGIYQVGTDIKPGTYVSAKPDSGNCYWARLSSDSGEFLRRGRTRVRAPGQNFSASAWARGESSTCRRASSRSTIISAPGLANRRMTASKRSSPSGAAGASTRGSR